VLEVFKHNERRLELLNPLHDSPGDLVELVVNVSLFFVLEHLVERCLPSVLHSLSHREVPMTLLLDFRGCHRIVLIA